MRGEAPDQGAAGRIAEDAETPPRSATDEDDEIVPPPPAAAAAGDPRGDRDEDVGMKQDLSAVNCR